MIRFIPELIITIGREVIAQHALAGEEACCVNLLFPHLHQVHVQEIERDRDGVLITARTRTGDATLSDYPRPLRAPHPVAPPAPSARKVTGWIATHPERLQESHQRQLKGVLSRCPELTALIKHVRLCSFSGRPFGTPEL